MSFMSGSSITRLPILAALGALAVFALLVVVARSTAGATVADGDVVLGVDASPGCTPGTDINCESSMTGIRNSPGGSAFSAYGTNGGFGVRGESDSGDGVRGISFSGIAVMGHSNTSSGVLGESAGTGADVAGVVGKAQTSVATGVRASNGGNGSATALRVSGKSTFSRSGTVTVSAGTSSATKSVSLTSASLVLATIQGNQAGTYIQGVTKVTGPSGSFTIHLNQNATANLPVAWFVLN
jgi:hypothetical protein